MPKILNNKLIEKFKDRESFSREELFDFYLNYEPDLKEGTFGWRIYDLKEKSIIKPIRRGVYTISSKSEYKPDLSSELIKLSKKINEKYQEVKYCIWETDWVNEFSQHQTSKRLIIIEIEKDFVESLYYCLKDSFKYDLYLNPDEKSIDFYISESNYPVVIKKLTTRSPIGKRTENKLNISIPLIEKILVDIYTEAKLFYFYQGSELMHIFKNVNNSYTINFTKLLSYAKRREREQEIKSFIKNNTDYLL